MMGLHPLLLFLWIIFTSSNAKTLDTLLLKHVEYHELNFYVGNIHCEFVQAAEKHVLQYLYDSISKIPDRIPAGHVSSTPSNFKHPSCLVVDVGMNDGFYTQMAAALGCRVISFELQDNCIQIATAAKRVNGFNSHQISIHNNPVSDSNNTELSMKISDDYPCSGTNAMNTLFTIHIVMFIVHYATTSYVSIQSFSLARHESSHTSHSITQQSTPVTSYPMTSPPPSPLWQASLTPFGKHPSLGTFGFTRVECTQGCEYKRVNTSKTFRTMRYRNRTTPII